MELSNLVVQNPSFMEGWSIYLWLLLLLVSSPLWFKKGKKK